MKKCTVLAHCLISLIKPRSFLSPVLLGITAYIYQSIGSKVLIDLLSSMGLCASYHDIKVLETSLIMAPKSTLKQGTFVQYAFDNCDFNVNTIDGNGTFHNMAGIKCITPSDGIVNAKDTVVKQHRLNHSALVENKGIVQAGPVNRTNLSGLQDFVFLDLDDLFPSKSSGDQPSPHNVLWMVAKFWNTMGVPGWQGFLENITSSGYSDTSTVLTLPFIMAPPSELETINTALLMAANDCDNSKVFVTFDLPLYMKAMQLTLSAPPESPLQKIVVRLGGFHLTMSFLGTIGFIMAESD